MYINIKIKYKNKYISIYKCKHPYINLYNYIYKCVCIPHVFIFLCLREGSE